MMTRIQKFFVLLPIGVLLACAADLKPRELLDAGDAYKRARIGAASKYALAELETAKQALQEAEAAWLAGEEEQVKDLSYLAERSAQLADAAGELQQANRDRAEAIKAQKEAQTVFQEETERRLAETRRKLDEEARRVDRQREQLRSATSRLEDEKAKRVAAESKAAAALASLEQLAKVKEEKRGVVITLSGAVLFATGRYELLPIAKNKLDEVAKALVDQGYKSIVVEGHTDARGGDTANVLLSERRATSVTNHLIVRGIEHSKIRAAGLGESRPVATNSTAEGRANNRRVEIVVQPE